VIEAAIPALASDPAPKALESEFVRLRLDSSKKAKKTKIVQDELSLKRRISSGFQSQTLIAETRARHKAGTMEHNNWT